MATLTASLAARVAAKERGLSLSPEPEAQAATETKVSHGKPAWLAQQRSARDRLWPLLSGAFPEAFRLPPVPLAIGIHRQIPKVAGDDIDPRELSAFMRYWTTRWSYLMAVWRGEPRRNLDGSPAGVPELDHRNQAALKLWGKLARQIAEPGELEHAPSSEIFRAYQRHRALAGAFGRSAD